MIVCLNNFLELVINIAIVVGIIFLTYYYLKLRDLDLKIESIHRKFERESAGKRGQGNGTPESIINGQIDQLKRERDETLAPFSRERERIISKIPFLK